MKHMKLVSRKHLKVVGGAIWKTASSSFIASSITRRGLE
jgi:hypothetical protein